MNPVARFILLGWMLVLFLVTHLMTLAMMHWRPGEHLKLLWEEKVVLAARRDLSTTRPGTLLDTEVYYAQRDHRIYRVTFAFDGREDEPDRLTGQAFIKLPKDQAPPATFNVVHVPGYPHLAHPADGHHAYPGLLPVMVFLGLAQVVLLVGLVLVYRSKPRPVGAPLADAPRA